MAEYIEREALIANFESAGAKFVYGDSIIKGIISRINLQPAANVVKVKHGKWEKAKGIIGINPATLNFEIGDTDRCSLCSADFIAVKPKYKYCPNCGAKMDGKDGGND